MSDPIKLLAIHGASRVHARLRGGHLPATRSSFMASADADTSTGPYHGWADVFDAWERHAHTDATPHQWLSASKRLFVLIDPQGVQVDVAIARNIDLERQLAAETAQRLREFGALAERLDDLEVRIQALEPLLAPAAEVQTTEFEPELIESVRQLVLTHAAVELGDSFVGLDVRTQEDQDLGGATLVFDIFVKADRENFAQTRATALRAFDAATREIDTSRMIISVRRRG